MEIRQKNTYEDYRNYLGVLSEILLESHGSALRSYRSGHPEDEHECAMESFAAEYGELGNAVACIEICRVTSADIRLGRVSRKVFLSNLDALFLESDTSVALAVIDHACEKMAYDQDFVTKLNNAVARWDRAGYMSEQFYKKALGQESYEKSPTKKEWDDAGAALKQDLQNMGIPYNPVPS